MLADELEMAIASHAAGEQTRLEQDLKPIADTEDRATSLRKSRHVRHHRRESRDRPAAQIVAIGKPSGEHDDVGSLQALVLVPHELRLLAEDMFDGVIRIMVAVRPRKHDDRELHLPVPTNLAHSTSTR